MVYTGQLGDPGGLDSYHFQHRNERAFFVVPSLLKKSAFQTCKRIDLKHILGVWPPAPYFLFPTVIRSANKNHFPSEWFLLALLYMVLQNRNTDVSYGCQKISAFGNFLSDLRTDSEYHHFLQSTVSLVGEPSLNADKRHKYKSLYFQIVDNIISMLSERFADCKSFAFLDLVNHCIFKQCRKGVPPDMLQFLKCKYGPFFHIQSLENQFLFIYHDPGFHIDSPLEILQYIYKCGLETSIPEAVKLLKLNSVIFISSASVERSFSSLKRVKTYLRNKWDKNVLCACVEYHCTKMS